MRFGGGSGGGSGGGGWVGRAVGKRSRTVLSTKRNAECSTRTVPPAIPRKASISIRCGAIAVHRGYYQRRGMLGKRLV